MPRAANIQFSTSRPPMLALWPERGIIHGFLGRRGGHSKGIYESMNLSDFVGDDPFDVAANWDVLRSTLPSKVAFARLKQVHGSSVRVVTRSNSAERPAADGMVTCEDNLVLGIFTADCVPVLMSSRTDAIVGALHAGWRGVLAGIATEGINAMTALGAKASDLRTALGPSIGPCCFEVDASLADDFVTAIPSASRHAKAGKTGKAYLDLRAIVRDQLAAMGLPEEAIENVGPCTRCASDRYFSRRAAGGAVTGLQMSFIGIVRK